MQTNRNELYVHFADLLVANSLRFVLTYSGLIMAIPRQGKLGATELAMMKQDVRPDVVARQWTPLTVFLRGFIGQDLN